MILERKPALVRRGVQQLMYVGDDDAVDSAVATGKSNAALIAAVAVALCSRGVLRLGAAGIAAAIALRSFR